MMDLLMGHFTTIAYGTMTALTGFAVWRIASALDQAKGLRDTEIEMLEDPERAAFWRRERACRAHLEIMVNDIRGGLRMVGETATGAGMAFTLIGLLVHGLGSDIPTGELLGTSIGTTVIGVLIAIATLWADRQVERANHRLARLLLPELGSQEVEAELAS